MSYRLRSRPTFTNGFARSQGESAYPRLWDGLAYGWVPSLGVQGATLFDVVHGSTPIILANSGGTNPTWGAERTPVGTSVRFDGSTQYGYTSQPVKMGSANRFVFSFWFYQTAYTNSNAIGFSTIPFDNNGSFFFVPDSSDGGADIGMHLNIGANYNYIKIVRPSAAAWHHYLIALDESTVGDGQVVKAVFVDGVPQTLTQVVANPTTSGEHIIDAAWYFAVQNNVGIYSRFNPGRMGDFWVYTNCLLGQAEAIAFTQGASPLALRDHKKRIGKLLANSYIDTITFNEINSFGNSPNNVLSLSNSYSGSNSYVLNSIAQFQTPISFNPISSIQGNISNFILTSLGLSETAGYQESFLLDTNASFEFDNISNIIPNSIADLKSTIIFSETNDFTFDPPNNSILLTIPFSNTNSYIISNNLINNPSILFLGSNTFILNSIADLKPTIIFSETNGMLFGLGNIFLVNFDCIGVNTYVLNSIADLHTTLTLSETNIFSDDIFTIFNTPFSFTNIANISVKGNLIINQNILYNSTSIYGFINVLGAAVTFAGRNFMTFTFEGEVISPIKKYIFLQSRDDSVLSLTSRI